MTFPTEINERVQRDSQRVLERLNSARQQEYAPLSPRIQLDFRV